MGDQTTVIFDLEYLKEIRNLFSHFEGLISDYYYEGENSHEFKSGFYERIISLAKNEEEKYKVEMKYKHYITKPVV